jgi:hypothetical protein
VQVDHPLLHVAALRKPPGGVERLFEIARGLVQGEPV